MVWADMESAPTDAPRFCAPVFAAALNFQCSFVKNVNSLSSGSSSVNTLFISRIRSGSYMLCWKRLCDVHQTLPLCTALKSASIGHLASSSSIVRSSPSIVLL